MHTLIDNSWMNKIRLPWVNVGLSAIFDFAML